MNASGGTQPLTDVAHPFNAPRIDPLSRSPTEVLGASGVECLLDLLLADKKRQRVRTPVLLLAPEMASSSSSNAATSGRMGYDHRQR